jgi:hypothetical protein
MTVGVASASGRVGISAVRWGAGPHAFELTSSIPEVIARAALVLRPWASAPAPRRPIRTWELVTGDMTPEWWALRTDGAADVQVAAHPRAVATRVEFLAVQSLFDGPPDVLTLHAALVARDRQGVLILGLPESGKSTLACGLWQNGFSLLGDDTAMVEPETAEARPAPRRVSVRLASRDLLGEPLFTRIQAAPSTDAREEGWLFHPDEIGGTRPPTVQLRTMFFLNRTNAAPMSGIIRPLPAAHATVALLPYSNLIRRVDAGALIPRLAALAGAVPAFDLRRAALADMVEAVGDSIASTAA